MRVIDTRADVEDALTVQIPGLTRVCCLPDSGAGYYVCLGFKRTRERSRRFLWWHWTIKEDNSVGVLEVVNGRTVHVPERRWKQFGADVQRIVAAFEAETGQEITVKRTTNFMQFDWGP